MSTRSPTLYMLQNTYPLPLLCNPLYDVVREESSRWLEAFSLYCSASPRQKEIFRAAEFELLIAYCYPTADHEALRTICDWCNAAFLVDDITDEQSGQDAAKTMQEYLDGLAGVQRVASDVYKMFYEFGPKAFKRFLASSYRTTAATALEAKRREENRILAFDEYVEQRRHTSGVTPCLDFIEYVFNFELPEDIVNHTSFRTLYDFTTDIVAWTNVGLGVTQAKEHGNTSVNTNILTVIMNEKHVELEEAMELATGLLESRLSDLGRAKGVLLSLPLDGTTRAHLRQYIFGHECWLVGNEGWHLQSGRYKADRDKVNDAYTGQEQENKLDCSKQ
ncbi:terpenoid synthase [Heliocybe sulcata]|uniref:Terpene synthase n=1 Tax=Heliocybe sulcata TaxID=5364 RepID=A0A5C3MK09_9AGAM|nr:terpenoid synthase [Heliocybe sulcata]